MFYKTKNVKFGRTHTDIWENNKLLFNFEVYVGQFVSSQYSHSRLYGKFIEENQVNESFESDVIQSGSIELFNQILYHKATIVVHKVKLFFFALPFFLAQQLKGFFLASKK